MSIPAGAISQLLFSQFETRDVMLETLEVVGFALLTGARLAALAAGDEPDARNIAHSEWQALEAFIAAMDAVFRAARFALPPDLHGHL